MLELNPRPAHNVIAVKIKHYVKKRRTTLRRHDNLKGTNV
jgi:hypothetical protein